MSDSRKAKNSENDNKEVISKISALTQEIGIAVWDVLIVGDGSGSGWHMGIGSACVLLDHASYASKLFMGGINVGTVTISEMLPYMLALDWYFSTNGPGKERVAAALANQRLLQVHVITDSAVVAHAGNNPKSRHCHTELWHALDAFKNRGLELTFHHWKRQGVTLNILSDEVARQARVAIESAYQNAIDVLSRKYPGMPKDAQPEDFFLWD